MDRLTAWNSKTHYWCRKCSASVPHEGASRDVNGAPKCPRCGSKLRVNPRHSKRKRLRLGDRPRVLEIASYKRRKKGGKRKTRVVQAHKRKRVAL